MVRAPWLTEYARYTPRAGFVFSTKPMRTLEPLLTLEPSREQLLTASPVNSWYAGAGPLCKSPPPPLVFVQTRGVTTFEHTLNM